MEDLKYLPPKFSYALKDLAKYYDAFEKGGPLSSLSKNSSEHSFSAHSGMSKNVDAPNTVRSSHSLKTIKEKNAKKSMPRIKYRHQSTIKSRRRAPSNGLPPLNKRSRSHSKTRSRSKSKSKLKSNSKINKISKYRKMKSKVMMAAERRGLKIKHARPAPLNQTLSQFRSPDHRFDVPHNINNSNILISDRSNMNSINGTTNFTSNNQNLPEFVKRLKNLDSNWSTTNYGISSDQSNLEDLSNMRYSSNKFHSEGSAKHYSKSEHTVPNVQVNLNAKYNICDNIIIQGNSKFYFLIIFRSTKVFDEG